MFYKYYFFISQFLKSKMLIIYDVYSLLFFVRFLWGIVVYNAFTTAEIMFNPQLQWMLDFKLNFPNDKLDIIRD